MSDGRAAAEATGGAAVEDERLYQDPEPGAIPWDERAWAYDSRVSTACSIRHRLLRESEVMRCRRGPRPTYQPVGYRSVAPAQTSATACVALDAGLVTARLVGHEIRLAREEPTVRIRSARLQHPGAGEEIVVCCVGAAECKKGMRP